MTALPFIPLWKYCRYYRTDQKTVREQMANGQIPYKLVGDKELVDISVAPNRRKDVPFISKEGEEAVRARIDMCIQTRDWYHLERALKLWIATITIKRPSRAKPPEERNYTDRYRKYPFRVTMVEEE